MLQVLPNPRLHQCAVRGLHCAFLLHALKHHFQNKVHPMNKYDSTRVCLEGNSFPTISNLHRLLKNYVFNYYKFIFTIRKLNNFDRSCLVVRSRCGTNSNLLSDDCVLHCYLIIICIHVHDKILLNLTTHNAVLS